MSSPKIQRYNLCAIQPMIELPFYISRPPAPSIYYFLGFVYKIIYQCAQNGSPKMSILVYYFLDFDMGYCKIL